MRLSKLQRFILEKCYNFKASSPVEFRDFYKKSAKGRKIIQDIIHRSLDSLVAGDLIIAFGKKTSKKWFIHKVKLTNLGKKLAIRTVKSKQRKLPLK